ncbi:MAG: hypothetical protein ACK4MX_05415, partial [Thermaurantiacus sp.]
MRPDRLNPFFAGVTSLAGCGPALARQLDRLGITRVRDLLFHLPVGVRETRVLATLADAAPGARIAIEVRVTGHEPPRGRAPAKALATDAAGEPLANNRPAYAVELIPSLAGDLEAALDRVSAIVPLDAEDRERIREEAAGLPPSAALTLASDIGWDAFAAVNLELSDMAGLQPARSYVRHYPDGEAFGHLIGYVGPPTPEQYRAERNPLFLLPGFRLGKDGVEKARDETLTGV